MHVNGLNIIIGSDPELFVQNEEGVVISGHDLIPGTKKKPHIVRGGAVQVDGTALEFNTEPADCFEAFNTSTVFVLNELNNMIPDELKLAAIPTAHFEQEYFDTVIPDEAKILGCEPDFNAYTGRQNRKPNNDVTFRTGAGHIHVGWTNGADINSHQHLMECRALVSAMDLFLGVPSVILDEDEERRKLYGKAGAYRPKSYGVEYRVLSNFWVMSERLRRWVYDNTIAAVQAVSNHEDVQRFAGLKDRWGDWRQQEIINWNEKADAEEFIEKYNIPMPAEV